MKEIEPPYTAYIIGKFRNPLYVTIYYSYNPLFEQTAIAEILSDMDNKITALEAKLSKAREVKQGMMSELLSGKVRLV